MDKNNKTDMVKSVIRESGDLAGIFEFDGETSYFYLYEVAGKEGQKVLGAIHIMSGVPDFNDEDIAIRWTSDEDIVGLFIRSQLWAVFDTRTNEKYGGNYHPHISPQIPTTISKAFG